MEVGGGASAQGANSHEVERWSHSHEAEAREEEVIVTRRRRSQQPRADPMPQGGGDEAKPTAPGGAHATRRSRQTQAK
ncbi:hypothetical protein NL676_021190 [Syzygium grande]|nr:hypothetical protein NL676_021190 [Syzygium grande]